METLAEFTEHVREVRDRYYDDMMESFLGFYQGGIQFAISILFNPDEIYYVELATDKFKKSIGERGYKVIKIVDDGNDRRFTIQRKDYERIERDGYVREEKIKSSKCIIS